MIYVKKCVILNNSKYLFLRARNNRLKECYFILSEKKNNNKKNLKYVNVNTLSQNYNYYKNTKRMKLSIVFY